MPSSWPTVGRLAARQIAFCRLIVVAVCVAKESLRYQGTRVLMGGIAKTGSVPPFAWRNQARRVALAARQWIVEDASWNAYHAPCVHEAPTLIAGRLAPGFAAYR